MIIQKFFRSEHSFKQLKQASKRIYLLQEKEIDLLKKNAVDYYRAKVKDGFKFQTWSDSHEDSRDEESKRAFETCPETLILPFPKEEEKVAEDESAADGAQQKRESCSSSQESSSDTQRSKREPTSNEL